MYFISINLIYLTIIILIYIVLSKLFKFIETCVSLLNLLIDFCCVYFHFKFIKSIYKNRVMT